MSEDNNTISLKVEIITPESVFYSRLIYMVTMPGIDGELGVLLAHVPLLTGLQPGLVTIYDNNMQVLDHIFITEGFAEISSTSATLLVQQASFLSDHNLATTESNLTNLKEDLELAKTDAEKILLGKKIEATEALLTILQR